MGSNFQFIKGGKANDERGQIRFVNDFDMSQVKRFYLISNANLHVVRGWRGHRIEQRWFYAVTGAFEIQLVRIDNWTNPSKHLHVSQLTLSAKEDLVLHIPQGYATSIRAVQEASELLVYADYGVDHAVFDDHIWPLDYFHGKD